MDKPVRNDGFTLIEAVFVCLVLMILLSLTLHKNVNNASQVLLVIKERIHQAHLNSIVYHQENELIFENDTLQINDQEYSMSPWTCEDLVFHYNSKGNISQANTLMCYYQARQVKFIFNLGTGRCRLVEE